MTGRTLADEMRFAVGTYTRLPVDPPVRLDAGVAGRGLAVGPVVGAGLGLVSGLPLLFTGVDLIARLLSATLVVALAAWLTRAVHWDGLADTADGLGSGAGPEQARAIMRRSDTGPFAVLVLIFTVAIQALSLAQLPAGTRALAAWILAVTLGRLAVAIGCAWWVHPARAEGLGALVVGSVTARRLAVAGLLTAVVVVVQAGGGLIPWSLAAFWAPLAAIVVALWLTNLAARRLGGTTGDVLGATAELATAAALLVMALR